METRTEMLVYLVHAIKQFCFGFEKLNETASEYEDGSAAKAFYMSAILDRDANDAMGGAFYKALRRHGLEDALLPISDLLNTPVGATTFGEIVRVFRNKAIVHSNNRDADLERIYRDADFENPSISRRFHGVLRQLFVETKLAVALIERCGLQPNLFGFRFE